MSQYGFHTQLSTTLVRGAGSVRRATWRLNHDLVYMSKLRGLITVPAGYITDFSSVPRIPLAYMLTADSSHASAVIHDYLISVEYKAKRITWSKASDVFCEAMKYEKVPTWRRWLMHGGVSLFGIFK